MARGTSFGTLVEMVRDEAYISTNSSRGADNLPYIKRLIQRHYETLADEVDWTFLTVRKEDSVVALQKGERYYDFPLKMDQRYAINAWVFWGNVWMKLRYGIGPAEYSAFNSDDPSIVADPVLKWAIRDDKQFEVWPAPASNGDSTTQPLVSPCVRFEGKRIINPIVGDGDPCDLDDQLIALTVSAEIMEKQDKGSGVVKAQAAQRRMNTLRGMYAHRNKVRVGMGEGDNRDDGMSPGWPRIRVFPASN